MTISKSGYNSYYKYKYAAASDICETLTFLLRQQGLEISQPMEAVGDFLVLHTLFVHSGGDVCRSSSPVPVPVSPHEFASYLSFVRKYELLSLVSIMPEDDPDGRKKTPSSPPVSRSGGRQSARRSGEVSKEEFQRIKAEKSDPYSSVPSDKKMPLPPGW